MHISKECNGKSTLEYEMFNKQWVIAKKVINFFRVGKWNLFKIRCLKKFSAANVCLNRSASAYRQLFCYKSPEAKINLPNSRTLTTTR